MRTVIARIFDYSLDGVIAEEDTPFFAFCRELPDDPAQEDRNRALYAERRSARHGPDGLPGHGGVLPDRH